MTAGILVVHVLTFVVGSALAIVAGAAALVIAAWFVSAVVYLLVTKVSHIVELVAPTSSLPRATAFFPPGDRP